MSEDSSSRGLSKFNAWWLAATILVLAVIAALVLILIFGQQSTPNGSDPTGSPSKPSAQPSTGGGEKPPVSDGTCDLPTGSDIPTTGPDAEWVNRSFLLTPESSTFGPTDREGSQWGCFAHSPTGALFAVANFLGGLQDADDADSVRAFVEASTVNNGGRQLFLEEHGASFGVPKEPGRTGAISGFRFDKVEPDAAVVRIGLSQSAGTDTVTAYLAVSVVWDPAASTWLVDTEGVPFDPTVGDLVGFTPWDASR